MAAGTEIYEAHPAMFRAHPFWFILCVLLIAVFGIGIIILRANALTVADSKLMYELSVLLIAAFGFGFITLLYWYIKTRATTLTVTDSELMYERGILSKDRTSMSLKHVRSVSIAQGFVNRILGVGTIQIFTAGDEPEFTIVDMPDPHVIREAIAKAQDMRSDKD
jgi:uncharacterized membrane protein YdbT with pleckstrin-like domain